MALEEMINSKELRSLVDDYRTMCLWNMATDFMPVNRRQVALILDRIERYGDMAAYRRAAIIRKWL